MKHCRSDITKIFFLILFLGFFASTTFFDHAHFFEGNIVVHSHPFKPAPDGKPFHTHNASGFLLVYTLQNIVAEIFVFLITASLFLILFREIIALINNFIPSGNYRLYNFKRGPPSFILL